MLLLLLLLLNFWIASRLCSLKINLPLMAARSFKSSSQFSVPLQNSLFNSLIASGLLCERVYDSLSIESSIPAISGCSSAYNPFLRAQSAERHVFESIVNWVNEDRPI